MMTRRLRFPRFAGFVSAMIVALMLAAGPWAQVAHGDQTADEVKLGAQAAKDIESHYRVVSDPAMNERLNTVVNTLVPILDRHDLTYHVKILDVPGVNAVGI